ncbi:3D domain-containing protein [Candidatus Falkowbacteria bacterium]|nr:3D domain-containing protein [Candidatus Falkowbacteria bacterium]
MQKSRILQKLRKYWRKLGAFLVHMHVRRVELAVFAVILFEFSFPQVSLAQELQAPASYQTESVMYETVIRDAAPVISDAAVLADFNNSLPMAADRQPTRTIWVTVTAYSSTPDQTDDSPCITANGFDVCEHGQEDVIAANFLPFGTTVKMPEYFGDTVFTVQDRMNARYYSRVDVWMQSREAAKQFGVRTLKVEVY